MMKLYKILFFNFMLIGIFIAISAYSWLTSWMGLEINLLSLMPLLKNSNNKFPTEATIKYFITQTMGSSLLLFSILNLLMLKTFLMNNYKITELMISSTLLLKMGAAPFHFWMPEMMSGLSWNNIFIMLTWQKITPMILIMHQIENNTLFFSIIIILSSMIGGIQGLNQTCMRKILTYSSINHMSWMISSILSSINIFYYYFLIYSFINLSIILILKKFHIQFLNQLIYMFSFSKKIKFIFMMNILSLGGLPPFLGFLPKWLTINLMVDTNNYTIAAILIIFTLITLYFYTRITFSSFSIFYKETFITNFKKMNSFHLMMTMFSTMGLFLCSMINSMM